MAKKKSLESMINTFVYRISGIGVMFIRVGLMEIDTGFAHANLCVCSQSQIDNRVKLRNARPETSAERKAGRRPGAAAGCQSYCYRPQARAHLSIQRAAP